LVVNVEVLIKAVVTTTIRLRFVGSSPFDFDSIVVRRRIKVKS